TASDPAKFAGAPAAGAANATLIVHEAPAANVPAQLGAPAGNAPVVTRLNCPGVMDCAPPVAAVAPLLVTVTSSGLLVVPAAQLPNASEVGDTVTAPPPPPPPAPWNSTAPASTRLLVFLALPKKSRPGASVKAPVAPLAVDGM